MKDAARKTVALLIALIGVFTGAGAGLGAEIMSSDLGFFLDTPEGYALSAPVSDGAFSFTDPAAATSLVIQAFKGADYPSAQAIVEDFRSSYGADWTGKYYRFQGRDAAIGIAEFSMDGIALSGYAFMANGREGEGDYLVLSLSPADAAASLDPLLASALDSFCMDEAGLRLPGPLSWWRAPPDAALEGGGRLDWKGSSFDIGRGQAGQEASQELVDREAAVLSLYDGSAFPAELAAGAWIRFFRIAYRDAYRRLDEVSFVLGRQIERLWFAEGRIEGTLAEDDFGAPDPAEPVPPGVYVSAVMDFVNSFTYERDPEGSDFVNPLTAVLDLRGDCDARALVAAIILHHLNQDACLMVSSAFSHAMALVDLPGAPGRNAGLELAGKRYLAAETTRREKPGMIDPQMAVAEEWIGVPLPF